MKSLFSLLSALLLAIAGTAAAQADVVFPADIPPPPADQAQIVFIKPAGSMWAGLPVGLLEVEWQNDFQSDAEAFRGYFIDDPTGTPILVLGDDVDGSYFKIGLGLSMVLTHGRSGFITYERVVGRAGMSQQMLSLGFRWEF